MTPGTSWAPLSRAEEASARLSLSFLRPWPGGPRGDLSVRCFHGGETPGTGLGTLLLVRMRGLYPTKNGVSPGKSAGHSPPVPGHAELSAGCWRPST